MDKRFGFIRVGAVVPKMKISDVHYNVEMIKEMMLSSSKKHSEITVFPELCISGYTCADLFLNERLIRSSLDGLKDLRDYTKKVKGIFIVGLPFHKDNQLFNVAAVLEDGHILGIVPKTYIPNYGEFYEKRWFSEDKCRISDEVIIDGEVIPFKSKLLFQIGEDERKTFGIEICEDLWAIYPPSNDLCVEGANLIFNLSASNEIIGKNEYRKNLVKSASEKNICGYIYASSGINESTTDLVFSGTSMIYENGKCLASNERFDFESNMIISDIDLARLENLRYKEKSYMGVIKEEKYDVIRCKAYDASFELERSYEQYPFVPSDVNKRNERLEEILKMQAYALARRLKGTGIKRCVIGISGGLDSTLAFLVTIKAYEILNLPTKDIYGITMPGLGTTKKTHDNASDLVVAYKATLKEIDIKESSLRHLRDIEHEEDLYDVTFENAQARERTQVLMDFANKIGGLVIGTGDMSELALGWCTYNGDHMSMYGVNVSIPKTLVRYLIEYYAINEPDKEKQRILLDIYNTPISPELLPPGKDGSIKQVTENTIGPYVLHDFFLYHFLRYGADPLKIYYIACKTFKDVSEDEIKKWLIVFLRRFFNNQFKRSCLPDGPKIGTISLSPRGDLRMPSDASVDDWIKELESL